MSLEENRRFPAQFAESWASVYFDLLRGFAALFVLTAHWSHLFFVPFADLTSHRFLMAVPYLFMGAGHQAVVAFFVLSGYFIGGAVFGEIENGQWAWPAYLLRRFVRLWIVLIPTLLLGLLWDSWGLHLGRAPGLYSGHTLRAVTDISRLLSPQIFFSNLFFLQTLVTPVFGSNGALWSLANEFWYYILFPLGVLVLRSRVRNLYRVLYGLLFLAISWFVRGDILELFPIWLLGALLFKLDPPSLSPRTAKILRIAAVAIYVPYFVTIRLVHSLPSTLRDYSLAILTFALLQLLRTSRTAYRPDALGVRASRQLARFSYTLYAAHSPLVLFLAALLVGDTPWYPTARSAAIGVVSLLGVLLYAYGIAYLTEFRTDAIRSRVEHYFGVATAPHPLPSNPLVPVETHPLPAAIAEPVLPSPLVAANATPAPSGLQTGSTFIKI